MKKSIFILFTVTLVIGFISCGSTRQTAEEQQQQKILREKI